MNNNLEHYLNVSEKGFLFFIDNMNKELAQWMQYKRPIFERSHVFFEFKSSQNSLSFKVYAGIAMPSDVGMIKGNLINIDDFFERLLIEKYSLNRLTYKETIKML